MHNLEISDVYKPVLEQVRTFINDEVIPVEQEFHEQIGINGDRWEYTPRMYEIIDGLKANARAQGLWNFFLPGTGTSGREPIGNLDYAYLAEEMGRSALAPEAFNCNAPDTGNMEVLHRYGSDEQKKQWLEPLLNGEIRSCFGMTEPNLASSDATNIATEAILDGDEWLINGSKYYISGAGDPRCKIMITMVVTSPEAPKHLRQSQILVPLNTPGVEIVEPMQVYGHDDAPHGHMHIRLNNVRVPKDNILLGEGRGFEISQGRLGPGRLHHCMRAIGAAERALELMIKRGMSRTAFGKPIINLGGNYDIIANSRIEIDAGRLLTLQTARAMDLLGNREARHMISGIKVYVPNMACDVIDRAIQMHGATGVSQWTPLAQSWINTRTLRLADGPDEVHRMVLARHEIAKHSV